MTMVYKRAWLPHIENSSVYVYKIMTNYDLEKRTLVPSTSYSTLEDFPN